MLSDQEDRYGSRRIIRNSLWNLIGQSSPLIAAVLAIPLLIKGIGVERFGVLSLTWMVIGYFSLFDLGLGRALTKLVSEKLGTGQTEEIPEIVLTTLFLMSLLGIVGGVVIMQLADWIVASVLSVPQALQGEAANAFWLLAWSVPVVIVTTGLRGILEAYHRFDLVNLVRVPMGIMTFLGPLAVLPFSNRLDAMVLVLLFLRIILCLVHAILCERAVPGVLGRFSISRRYLRPLLGFGGWMTVTNIFGPLMVYLDRFVIAGSASMAAVAYYVIPYEMITKLLVVPSALVGVLFPAFSSSLAGDRRYAIDLFHKGVRWIFLALFPIVLLATIFASDVLRLWLSDEFSQRGTSVLQWLALGVFLNGLAQIPFTFIQGAGRPDFTAKMHFVELPFYLIALNACLQQWGIVGAAAAWALRAGLDAVALLAISGWLEKGLRKGLRKDALIAISGAIVLAVASSIPDDLWIKLTFTAGAIVSFVFLAWNLLLTQGERSVALNIFRN